MTVTIVHVQVKPECIAAFQEASIINHLASIKEQGNFRFDVLQSEEDPCRFALYEAYASKLQASAHKETPHYATWRNTVADMMAEPRKGVTYTSIAPNGNI
jgi:autoinducer 2-degrading protein